MKYFIACVCTMACFLAAQPGLMAASSFDSLPDSTVMNMRIPNGAAAAAAMKKSKMYSMLNNQERWDKLRSAIESNDDGGLEALEAALADFELSVDDISSAFTGETGVAVTLHPHEESGKDPLFCFLFYISPEAELNQRLIAALNQVLENNQTEDLQRNDYQIGDHEIMELNVEEGEAYFFINHSDKGFAIALTDRNGAENAKQVLASFLDARNGEGDANGFAKKVMATNGLADAIPEGAPLIEMTYNPQVAIQLMPVGDMATQAMAGDEIIEALGLNSFKPGIFVASIDGLLMRQSAFMGLSKPLKGIAKLFNSPALPPGPAAWVPANVPSYAHIGIDLPGIYKSVSEMMVEIMGPAGEAKMLEVNQAPMMFLGMDLETFLGTFGNRIVLLNFGKKKPEGAGGNPMMGTFSDRMSFTWDMNDTTAMKQIMPMLQGQAGMMGGMPVNEQGATGVRINMSMMQPGLEGGLFVTDSQLMIALGAGVGEQVLSAMQSPPEQADSLAATQLVKTANELLEPKEGFLWNVQDTNDMFTAAVKMMHEDFKLLAAMDPNMGLVLPLLPSAEDVEGMFGVGVVQATQDADGITFEGVVELGASESEE